MQEKYRLLRDAAYDEGTRLFPILERHGDFRDFVCLYIAEGSKRNRNEVAICNSDEAVMRVGQRWMLLLSAHRLQYSVQYHADQNLRAVRGFWARELDIDPAEIKVQRKSNSNQLKRRTWRSEHGILTIRASDTYFRAELQAWMDWVADDWLDSPN